MPNPKSERMRTNKSNQGQKIFPLPKDLSEILKNNKVSNPVLALNFLLTWEPKWNLEKDTSLKAIIDAIKEINKHSAEYQKRLNAQLSALGTQGYVTESFHLKTESRLIVGLGAKGPLEIGITLHHLYGFPYVPASALKGICRYYAEQIADANPLEQKTIFGSSTKNEKQDSEKQLGSVVFLDAVPSSPKLEKDIMNPHYSPYYMDKKTPGDWYNPVPIFFLTIPSETEFWFGMAADNKENLSKAKEWLIGGLNDLGAGAKTSSGYGFFSLPSKPNNADPKAETTIAEQQKPKTQTPKGKGIVRARIIDDQSKPPKVRILEGEHTGKDTIMPGVNLAGLNLKKESEINVEIILSRDKKRLDKVTFKGTFKG